MTKLFGRLLCRLGHHDPRLVKLTGAAVNRRGAMRYNGGYEAWEQWEDFEQLWALDCPRCSRRVWTGGMSELVRAGRLGIRGPVE